MNLKPFVFVGTMLLATSAVAATPAKITNPKDILGYSIGMSIGQNVKQQGVAGNKKMMITGFAAAINGTKPAVSESQMKQALVQYEQQLQAKKEAKSIVLVRKHMQQLVHATNNPVMGNPKGKVTLVEFFDFQCVHCRRMGPRLAALAKADPQLRIVFKDFPIFGKDSIYAARASLAALKQNKTLYWKFHNALLTSPKKLTHTEVLNLAKKTGLNMSTLKKDMKSPAITKELAGNWKLAESIGINFTPGFIVAPTNAKKTKSGAAITPAFIPGEVPLQALANAVQSVQNQIPGQEKFKFVNLKPVNEASNVWVGI